MVEIRVCNVFFGIMKTEDNGDKVFRVFFSCNKSFNNFLLLFFSFMILQLRVWDSVLCIAS